MEMGKKYTGRIKIDWKERKNTESMGKMHMDGYGRMLAPMGGARGEWVGAEQTSYFGGK
jgi:hypothetical protein